MSKVFKQDRKGKEQQPGGPFLITMLFKEPVELPDKEKVAEVCRKHLGHVDVMEMMANLSTSSLWTIL